MAQPEQSSLSLVASSLHFPGTIVTGVTPLGFTFREDATPEELITFGQNLCATRAYLRFALGSVFVALIHSRARLATSKEQERAQEDAEDYARAFAVAHNIDPKEFREILGVARFYSPADLTGLGSLSFEHYREAMWGAALKAPGGGGPTVLPAALSYLRVAHKEGWKYTQLRRHIRSLDAVLPEERQLELSAYSAVFAFMRFAKRELQEVHTYTPERASLILADLSESTFEYLDALREISAGIGRASRYSPSDERRG